MLNAPAAPSYVCVTANAVPVGKTEAASAKLASVAKPTRAKTAFFVRLLFLT